MWRRAFRCAVLAPVVLLAPGTARGQSPDASEVIRRVQRQDTAPDEQADFVMQLIDGAGQVRERTGTVYQRQVVPGSVDKMTLIRFLSPPDLKGSGVLTIEHPNADTDQWVYLPAYHTTRRVAPANRGDRYMGTDFLYEDLMRAKVEEYRYTTQGSQSLGDIVCVVIEAVPVAERVRAESAYSRQVIWVDPARDLILRADYYDRDGRLFKRLTVPEVERATGKYRWVRVKMEDFIREHATIVRYRNRKIGGGVPERYFTERYLRRGQ